MRSTRVHLSGKPSREEVARRANTSTTTVSRVLAGRTDLAISPETWERVIRAAEELGYRPSPIARALKSGRSGVVAFWMSLHYSRYRAQVLDEMRLLLGQTEMALSISDVDEEFHWDHNFARALRVAADGIIAFDTTSSLEAFADRRDHLAAKTPFVSMGAYWTERLSYVGVDLRAGTDLAMRHLLETGRRRIALLAPRASGLHESGARFEGYAAALEEAGLSPRPLPVLGDNVRSVVEVLESAPDVDALLCINDDMALWAETALRRLGRMPGHDVAIVGFDGIKETENALCPITTVRQPIREMCALAYGFVQAQMQDPSLPAPQQILLPELVVRESTRP